MKDSFLLLILLSLLPTHSVLSQHLDLYVFNEDENPTSPNARECISPRFRADMVIIEKDDTIKSKRKKLLDLRRIRNRYTRSKGHKYTLTRNGLLLLNITGTKDPHHGLMAGSCRGFTAGYIKIKKRNNRRKISEITIDNRSLAFCPAPHTMNSVQEILQDLLDKDNARMRLQENNHPDC